MVINGVQQWTLFTINRSVMARSSPSELPQLVAIFDRAGQFVHISPDMFRESRHGCELTNNDVMLILALCRSQSTICANVQHGTAQLVKAGRQWLQRVGKWIKERFRGIHWSTSHSLQAARHRPIRGSCFVQAVASRVANGTVLQSPAKLDTHHYQLQCALTCNLAKSSGEIWAFMAGQTWRCGWFQGEREEEEKGKWECWKEVGGITTRSGESLSLEETSAVIKNTDTTKDDGLPCDHFSTGFTLHRVKPSKWKSKEMKILILLQRRKRKRNYYVTYSTS